MGQSLTLFQTDNSSSVKTLGVELSASEEKPGTPLTMTNLSLSKGALLVVLAYVTEPTKGCKSFMWHSIPFSFFFCRPSSVRDDYR